LRHSPRRSEARRDSLRGRPPSDPLLGRSIVGDSKLHHPDDALASVNVKLFDDEITLLQEPYVPHPVVSFV
jgi:hypothetical protein